MVLTHHPQKLRPFVNLWGNPYVRVAVIALVYFAAARFSLSLIIKPEGIAAIWPPSGIFLSAILLSKREIRPYLVGVLFITDLIAEVMSGTPLLVSIFYSLALAGDAVFSSWLLLRFIRDPFLFRNNRDMLGFIFLCVGLSNALMSLIAAAAARLIPGTMFWSAWAWWAASAGIGNLLMTPLILSWREWRKPGFRTWSLKRVTEEIIVFIFIVLLNYLAFHFLSENNQFSLLLTYLNFPFLLWAALRLSLRGVTITLGLLAGIAIYSAITGEINGIPFSGIELGHVISIQLYLVVMAIPSLLLVTDVTERKRTEGTLRENEARYQSLFDDSPISLWEEDFSELKIHIDELRAQGIGDFEHYIDQHPDELLKCIGMARILDVNSATVMLFQAKSKNDLILNLVNIATEETLAVHRKSILAIADGKTTFAAEVTNRSLSGEILIVSLRWAVPPGYENTYQKAIVSMVDITDRKKFERELQDSEERFRHLAENIKDVFWINDAPTGRIEYVSPAYERIWGKRPEDLYRDVSNWVEAIHPEDKDRVVQAFDDRARNGTYDIEYRIVKPGNKLHWIHDRGFPVFDEAGKLKRWVGVAADITERKLAEEALRERNYFIETILENAPIGFAVNTISDGTGTFVSSKFDAIYGVPRGSMNTVDEYFERVFLDPAFREKMRARMLADMASGDSARMSWEDIPITTDTGENRVVTAINIPLFEQDLMISTVQDVTKRYRAEEGIRQRNEELDKIREILSTLSSQFNLDSILNRALLGALELTKTSGGIIFLVDPHQQELMVFAEHNVSPQMMNELNGHSGNIKDALSEMVVKTGQPFVAWNAASDPQDITITALCRTGVQFFAAFPLQIKNQYIGVLSIFEYGEKRPTRQTLDLLQDLCSPIALAIENAQLFEATRHEALRAESLARTAARLIAQMDFDTVIHIVCEEAARALDAPVSIVFLYDLQQDQYKIGADYGFPEAYRGSHLKVPASVYQSLTSHYGTQGMILNMQELHNVLEISPFPDIPLRSIIGVNILHGSERIGILCVATNAETRKYGKEDLDLIQGIADQAAQAITRARLFEQVSAGRKRLQTLSQRLLEVQESERRTLALELHDELGQLLNSAKMSLDMIANLPAQSAAEHLQRAQGLVSDLVSRVREMSLQLRPSMLDDMGLLPTLEWLFKNYHLQTGKLVVFKQSLMEQRFPAQVEITAYRLIQEALTNIIRHAGDDKQVRVEVWVDEQTLNIQVRDWGKGFNPLEAFQKHESSGLSGMRERARLLGGELVVESAPGAGTSLSARLPLSTPLSDMG